MPAIQLERLHRQTEELNEAFDHPARFVNITRDLFEFYADRTRRSRRTGEPEPVLPAYRVPEPVLRRILFVVSPLAEENPEQALLLCDSLWAEGVQEFRLLALRLLGQLEADHAGSIIERVETWGLENQEETLLELLADDALARLRAENIAAFLELTETLVAHERERAQALGLRALTILLASGEFENLPIIFRILTPRVQASRTAIRPYVLDVLNQLAAQSAAESTFFLREMLTSEESSKTTEWLVRHCLDAFPDEQRERLRSILREKRGR